MTQLPDGIDTSVPHSARVYDYWLGGKDNFEADRRAAEAGYRAFPGVVQTVHANRAFLARVVRYLVTEAGIRQFLDVGAGLPTTGNTHEVAQEKAPESRVVYVDSDPVTIMHGRALLRSAPEGSTGFVHADARDPASVIEQAAATLDFSEPVAVLLLAVLHEFPDDAQAAAITEGFAAALAPGSHLAISHVASDMEGERLLTFAHAMGEQGMPAGALRSHEQVASLLGGLEVVSPGVVPLSQWRPDTAWEASVFAPAIAAVGRKG